MIMDYQILIPIILGMEIALFLLSLGISSGKRDRLAFIVAINNVVILCGLFSSALRNYLNDPALFVWLLIFVTSGFFGLGLMIGKYKETENENS